MRRFIKDQQGATLMEVMIAVGIIGVGLWALSAAIPLAAYGIHEGNHLSTATFLANQRLEQVRNARWEEGPPCQDKLGVSASSTAAPTLTNDVALVLAYGSCAGAGTTFPDESPVAAPYDRFTRSVRITRCVIGAPCNGIVDKDLRQVEVTVTYRPMTGSGLSAAGTAKASTVTMYVAKR